MCMGLFCGLPYGLPVTGEMHDQMPENVKTSWALFNEWWEKALRDDDGKVSRKDMPEDVVQAMHVVLQASIPGYDGCTMEESCYMIGVQSLLVD